VVGCVISCLRPEWPVDCIAQLCTRQSGGFFRLMWHVLLTVKFLMVVTTNVVFRDVASRSPLEINGISSEYMLKMKALVSSENSANFSQTAERHNI
jgi:hypothetical protein